jgi:hypothetical protein
MSKRKRRKSSSREFPTKPRGRRAVLFTVTVVLAVGIVVAFVLRGREPGGAGSLPATPSAQGAQAAPIGLAAGQEFRALNGRWLRPDGGYILEIRDVDAGGKMDAAYLNPQPIHVARAEVTQDGPRLKVFVELRAPGYPGSTYTLTYDPKRDQLQGAYFQAALRQSFDVVFVRMK